MQKNKKGKIFIIACLIYSLVALYGFIPTVHADISAAKDTLNDADRSAMATSTITFTIGTSLVDTDYIDIDFAAEFGNVNDGDISCPANSTYTIVDTDTVRCTGG